MKHKHYRHPSKEFTLGRAYPKTRKRPSGWHDWFIQSAVGDVIEGDGYSGFEKTKGSAEKAASHAAMRYNEELAAPGRAIVSHESKGWMPRMWNNS